MSENVKHMADISQKHRPYPKESELSNRLNDLIHEYDNEISYVAVQGILLDLSMQLREGMKKQMET